MADIPVSISTPAQGIREVDMPGDVAIQDLIPELVSALELPTQGPDGRIVGYKLSLKRTGAVLEGQQTLEGAGVQPNDTLLITTDITAGIR